MIKWKLKAIFVVAILLSIVIYSAGLVFKSALNGSIFTATSTLAITLFTSALLWFFEKITLTGTTDYIKNVLKIYSEMDKRGIDYIGDCDHKYYWKKIDDALNNLTKDEKIQVMLHTGKQFLTDFNDFVKRAIAHGCNIEILIASTKIASNTGNEEVDYLLRNLCGGSKKEDIEDFFTDLEKIFATIKSEKKKKGISKYRSTVLIKEYDFAPTGNLLIIGNYIRFIPYLSKKKSNESIAIIGKAISENDENKFKIFKEIFQEIWDDIDIKFAKLYEF
ncbi:MAG: hypothetical protein FWF44_05055 [Defluviitaleaceae bacterium]|nr:hypothetical protein [Defluviitaleaceae bacterium]